MSAKPCLLVITNNHFDLTWRRCWDRRFAWQGKTYASYSEIEQWYMEENLALAAADPAYRFEAESVAVLRQFLRRCPQRRTEVAALVRAGRFGVAGAGDNIVDAVMILGESLVRNFTHGLAWLEREFAIRPVLGVRNDAFGNPAQLPQILRGCGMRWVNGLSYSPARGRYWRGLDGSTVCTAHLPTVGSGGSWRKHPPCPACQGVGCPACRGRGIDPAKGIASLPGRIDDEALARHGVGQVRITPEEDLPNPGIIAWAKGLADRYDVRFALEEDASEHLRPLIDAVDAPPPGELHAGVELGFNNSG